MDFRIKALILWPKNQTKPIRRIDFDIDKVNVITGGSEKGKSAIIAIIDYCLGSGQCRIPTRTIRYLTEWFGILVQLKDGDQLLLVRREPGAEKISGEMFIKQGKGLVIPEQIKSNANYEDVKHRLNDIAKLPYIDFSKDDKTNAFQSRPSFRDMASFIFQPQYIVANQSSLFYKSDSFKHREKLRTIFPYILQAVTNEYLQLKEELKDKEREVLALDRELEKRQKVTEKWLGEIRGNYLKAIEFGLLENAPYPDDDWKSEKYISYLQTIPARINETQIPLMPKDAIITTTKRIIELQEQEHVIAHEIQNLRMRYELVKKVEASNREYRDTLLSQRQRLDGVGWFNKKISKTTTCPLCNAQSVNAKEYLNKLVDVNKEILEKGFKTNDHYAVLNSELDRLNKELKSSEGKLNNVRTELRTLQSADKLSDKRIQTMQAIYRFAGQLETELKNYEVQLNNGDLASKILAIRERIKEINESIREDLVKNKLHNALRKIADSIKFYAEMFKAANYNETIELNIKDLTINFISQDGRRESLYEIGSGSNYMAYHLATILALHEFFIKAKNSPVPNFIILDQPSQAYFPDTDREFSESNEDVLRVKRIFEVLSKAIERTGGKLQIIILEHVGDYAWDGFANVNKVKRWRENETDNALITKDWLTND